MRRDTLTRRENHGGGHRYYLDGKPVDGVTGILGDGIPKPNLVGWAGNTTAAYAIDHWDELAELGLAERLKTLERSRFASRDTAATRGTSIHKLAHELGAGHEVDVPEPLRGYVDAYLQFADDWHLVDELIEVTVINREWSYMGTIDLIGIIGGEGRWLLDFKTGGSGIWPETALQLAAYANAETYLDGDTEHPMPPIDQTGAVWLRADGYDLYPIPAALDETTFSTFLDAQAVARFTRDAKDRGRYIGDAIKPENPRLEVVS